MQAQLHIQHAVNQLYAARKAPDATIYAARLTLASVACKRALAAANRDARHLRPAIFVVMNKLRAATRH